MGKGLSGRCALEVATFLFLKFKTAIGYANTVGEKNTGGHAHSSGLLQKVKWKILANIGFW